MNNASAPEPVASATQRGTTAKGPATAPLSRGQGATTLLEAFDPRHNSLNLIRLLLALAVLVAHCFMLGGFGGLPIGDRTGVGGLAVMGFFALSGFLVAGSLASASSNLDYLRKRVLRIYPGFLMALIVTAFVIAPLSWLLRPPTGDCTGACALFGPQGSLSYVLHDLGLWPFQRDIVGTPAGVPVPGIWNGPLWTLPFEFLCYLILLGLGMVGIFRRRRVLLAVAAACWGVELVISLVPSWSRHFNSFEYPVLEPLVSFLPVFLAGSLLWVFRDRIPFDGRLAALCTALFIAAYWLPLGLQVPVFALTSVTVAAPLLAYPMLWLGIRVRASAAWRRHDFSYGTYIYACPVQQILVIWGLARFGVWAYIAGTLVLTAPLALASWHFVESPALRLARRKRSVPAVGVAT